MTVEYLDLADVIALHDAILRRMGAPFAAIRDEGALDSAITRAKTAHFYDGADVIRQAVLMAIGISQAQAFVDGNKRAAYAATETFLLMNGYTVTGDPIGLAKALEEAAIHGGKLDAATDSFERWLRDHVQLRSETN